MKKSNLNNRNIYRWKIDQKFIFILIFILIFESSYLNQLSIFVNAANSTQCDTLTCKQCLTEDGNVSCKTCINSAYKLLENECVATCPTYTKEENGTCIQICHHSCASCDGDEYYECLTCRENRQLDESYFFSDGVCKCKYLYTDDLTPTCQDSSTSSVFNTIVFSLAIISLIAIILLSIIEWSGFIFYYFIDCLQCASLLYYINIYNSYQFDDIIFYLDKSNISSTLKPDWYRAESNFNKEYNNWKVYKHIKSANFAMEQIIVFIITFILWIVALISIKYYQIKNQNDQQEYQKNQINILNAQPSSRRTDRISIQKYNQQSLRQNNQNSMVRNNSNSFINKSQQQRSLSKIQEEINEEEQIKIQKKKENQKNNENSQRTSRINYFRNGDKDQNNDKSQSIYNNQSRISQLDNINSPSRSPSKKPILNQSKQGQQTIVIYENNDHGKFRQTNKDAFADKNSQKSSRIKSSNGGSHHQLSPNRNQFNNSNGLSQNSQLKVSKAFSNNGQIQMIKVSKNPYFISILIFFFMITNQETLIVIFGQINYSFNFKYPSTALSTGFCILAILYIAVFLMFLSKKLLRKKIRENIVSNANDYNMLFYLVDNYHQDRFYQRGYFGISFIRKLISSFACTILYKSPISQIIVLLVNHGIYLVYLMAGSPIKNNLQKYLVFITHAEVLLCYLFQAIICSKDTSLEAERESATKYTEGLIYIIIILLLTFILYALYILINWLVQKWRQHQNQKKNKQNKNYNSYRSNHNSKIQIVPEELLAPVDASIEENKEEFVPNSAVDDSLKQKVEELEKQLISVKARQDSIDKLQIIEVREENDFDDSQYNGRLIIYEDPNKSTRNVIQDESFRDPRDLEEDRKLLKSQQVQVDQNMFNEQVVTILPSNRKKRIFVQSRYTQANLDEIQEDDDPNSSFKNSAGYESDIEERIYEENKLNKKKFKQQGTQVNESYLKEFQQIFKTQYSQVEKNYLKSSKKKLKAQDINVVSNNIDIENMKYKEQNTQVDSSYFGKSKDKNIQVESSFFEKPLKQFQTQELQPNANYYEKSKNILKNQDIQAGSAYFDKVQNSHKVQETQVDSKCFDKLIEKKVQNTQVDSTYFEKPKKQVKSQDIQVGSNYFEKSQNILKSQDIQVGSAYFEKILNGFKTQDTQVEQAYFEKPKKNLKTQDTQVDQTCFQRKNIQQKTQELQVGSNLFEKSKDILKTQDIQVGSAYFEKNQNRYKTSDTQVEQKYLEKPKKDQKSQELQVDSTYFEKPKIEQKTQEIQIGSNLFEKIKTLNKSQDIQVGETYFEKKQNQFKSQDTQIDQQYLEKPKIDQKVQDTQVDSKCFEKPKNILKTQDIQAGSSYFEKHKKEQKTQDVQVGSHFFEKTKNILKSQEIQVDSQYFQDSKESCHSQDIQVDSTCFEQYKKEYKTQDIQVESDYFSKPKKLQQTQDIQVGPTYLGQPKKELKTQDVQVESRYFQNEKKEEEIQVDSKCFEKPKNKQKTKEIQVDQNAFEQQKKITKAQNIQVDSSCFEKPKDFSKNQDNQFPSVEESKINKKQHESFLSGKNIPIQISSPRQIIKQPSEDYSVFDEIIIDKDDKVLSQKDKPTPKQRKQSNQQPTINQQNQDKFKNDKPPQKETYQTNKSPAQKTEDLISSKYDKSQKKQQQPNQKIENKQIQYPIKQENQKTEQLKINNNHDSSDKKHSLLSTLSIHTPQNLENPIFNDFSSFKSSTPVFHKFVENSSSQKYYEHNRVNQKKAKPGLKWNETNKFDSYLNGKDMHLKVYSNTKLSNNTLSNDQLPTQNNLNVGYDTQKKSQNSLNSLPEIELPNSARSHNNRHNDTQQNKNNSHNNIFNRQQYHTIQNSVDNNKPYQKRSISPTPSYHERVLQNRVSPLKSNINNYFQRTPQKNNNNERGLLHILNLQPMPKSFDKISKIIN